MKRIISALLIFIFLNLIVLNAFSFNIDGNDDSIEWDGATAYKLVDGESNCGVNFGVVKVKFDYESNAVCLCFHFADPDLTPDNDSAGVFITVDKAASFEIAASDRTLSENIAPYSFDGAILIDENNGATCEIRIGIKSGLPESVDFDARFIDSNGFYSDYYHFIIVNEKYETTIPTVIQPTADNEDPAYNPDLLTLPTEKTTRKKATKAQTTKKQTTKKSTTRTSKSTTYSYDSYIKTSPSYDRTERKTTKPMKSDKVTDKENDISVIEKVYYHEKEVYISEIYVTDSVLTSSWVNESVFSETDFTTDTNTVTSSMTLSKGTKLKKLFAGISLVAFISVACLGTYSAKKSKNTPDNKD